MTAFWSSFLVVALAEMGDKTQLVALSLSSRFGRPWIVMAGIFIATVLNHALASTVGVWLASTIPHALLAWILALGFIGFGIWTLIPDRIEETRTQGAWGPLVTTVVVFFLAEMGDKTQLATIVLAASTRRPVAVFTGASLGLAAVSGIGVVLGSELGAYLPLTLIKRAAGVVFVAIGLLMLANKV